MALNIEMDAFWYDQVKLGHKTVDVFINDEKFANLKKGDNITLIRKNHTLDNESMVVNVVDLNTYDTITDFILQEGVKNTLPGLRIKTICDAMKIYRKTLHKEDVLIHGIITIKYQRINVYEYFST